MFEHIARAIDSKADRVTCKQENNYENIIKFYSPALLDIKCFGALFSALGTKICDAVGTHPPNA